MSKQERPTRNAVFAYAERLRDRAEHTARTDPYARPYYPTTAAAAKVYNDSLRAIQREEEEAAWAMVERGEQPPEPDAEEQAHQAAERALATLAARALLREREQAQHDAHADRSVKRLKRQRERAERDREAQRLELTVGQRIDRALAGFATIAAPPAAVMGADTAGGDPHTMPSDHGDPAGEAAYIARKAVRQIEDLLDQARRRNLDRAA